MICYLVRFFVIDRQTESGAYEPTVQVVQVGSQTKDWTKKNMAHVWLTCESATAYKHPRYVMYL